MASTADRAVLTAEDLEEVRRVDADFWRTFPYDETWNQSAEGHRARLLATLDAARHDLDTQTEALSVAVAQAESHKRAARAVHPDALAARQAAYDTLPKDADDDLYAMADRMTEAILAIVRVEPAVFDVMSRIQPRAAADTAPAHHPNPAGGVRPETGAESCAVCGEDWPCPAAADTAQALGGPQEPMPGDVQRRCWTLYAHSKGSTQCRLYNGHEGDHDFGATDG